MSEGEGDRSEGSPPREPTGLAATALLGLRHIIARRRLIRSRVFEEIAQRFAVVVMPREREIQRMAGELVHFRICHGLPRAGGVVAPVGPVSGPADPVPGADLADADLPADVSIAVREHVELPLPLVHGSGRLGNLSA